MKYNKFLVVTAIVLGILLVVMGSYIVYDNFIKTEAMPYTYDSMKGLYKYASETVEDEYGEHTALYYLYLNENGTFNYKMGTGALHGHIGNYIIKDNTIVLNYLFSTNSGAGIDATTGSKTITIAAKDTLVDANPSVTVANMTKVTLKKATSAEESEFAQYEDVSYILKNYELSNDATTK